MIETVVKLGRDERMVGILSSGNESETAPVALMFNAGFLHRVGPFRLWVDLARQLARKNIPSFRFDLCGLGDSGPNDASGDPVQSAIEGLVAAMDYVESKLGKREFIVLGLCSGADYAHPAAKADPRIRGAVLIDGYGYRTKGFHLNHHLRRVTSLRRWRNMLKRNLGLEQESEDQSFIASVGARDFPDVDRVQSEILKFLSEGRRLYYIFTAGVPDYYNYENQFWEMFPKVKPQAGLSYSFYESSDHTFSLVKERAQLTDRLLEFVTAGAAVQSVDAAHQGHGSLLRRRQTF